MTRVVVTGSGRCGTKYLSLLLSAVGVPCGHEQVYNADGAGEWPDGLRADSSWMAATMLHQVDAPVALLVRHPLSVVKSWVEIGFFAPGDADNPTHGPLQRFAPQVYDEATPADRALMMWLVLNRVALPRAELVIRLEQVVADVGQVERLARWAGGDPALAGLAHAAVPRCNRHEEMRARTGVRHVPSWATHRPGLARPARDLARLIGYDPDRVPHG